MIRAQRSLFYFVDEKAYASLEEAQKADLIALMPAEWQAPDKEGTSDWMLKNAEAICDTLQTTPRSRLKARKLHGATRKPRQRKDQPEAQAA